MATGPCRTVCDVEPAESLESLPNDRRDAVAAWLAEPIGDCVECRGAVRRTDPHRTEAGGFAHMQCDAAPGSAQDTADEPVSAAVAARARRADWG